jgi:hypothetical protein
MEKKLSGVVIAKLNTPNRNGITYTSDAMSSALINSQSTVFGQLGSPTAFNTLNTKLISHAVDNLRVEDDKLVGDITVLDTRAGKLLTEMLSHDVPISFGISGTGFISDGGNVENFNLLSISVIDPLDPV